MVFIQLHTSSKICTTACFQFTCSIPLSYIRLYTCALFYWRISISTTLIYVDWIFLCVFTVCRSRKLYVMSQELEKLMWRRYQQSHFSKQVFQSRSKNAQHLRSNTKTKHGINRWKINLPLSFQSLNSETVDNLVVYKNSIGKNVSKTSYSKTSLLIILNYEEKLLLRVYVEQNIKLNTKPVIPSTNWASFYVSINSSDIPNPNLRNLLLRDRSHLVTTTLKFYVVRSLFCRQVRIVTMVTMQPIVWSGCCTYSWRHEIRHWCHQVRTFSNFSNRINNVKGME